MTLEEIVYSKLSTEAAVASAVGTRIYPNVIPDEEAPLPWILYTVTNSAALDTLGGTAGELANLVVLSISDTYASGKVLADAARSALNGMRGGIIGGCSWAERNASGGEDDGYQFEDSFTVVVNTTPSVSTVLLDARPALTLSATNAEIVAALRSLGLFRVP